VKRGDDLLLAKGYGLADMENALPATAETVYNIGSVTKQFTAAAIMQLVERGKVGLDDLVTKYLPDFPNQGYEVTIRHLLTHTSGVGDPARARVDPDTLSEDQLFALRAGGALESNVEWMARLEDQPFHDPPGERYDYSNSGFNLLGMVIEEVSGVSYPEYIRVHLFEPLGLAETSDCDKWSIIPWRARGYMLRDGAWRNDPPWGSARGASGICSNVLDLLSWNSALRGGRVVSMDTYRQMTTPATLNSGSKTDYGFGLSLNSPEDHALVHHGGGWIAFRASLAQVVDLDIDIVVLSNTASVSAEGIGNTIGRWVLGLPIPTGS
jgi:CubicO group peptidase (beta-lactamase class C family)